MNQHNKKAKPTHANTLRDALQNLHRAINTAQYEIDNAGFHLSNEDIGQLHVAYSPEDEGIHGIHISNMHGNVEFEDGWTISFDDLAKELWGMADCDQSKKLIAGMRSMVELMEKWETETQDKIPTE